MYSCVLSHCLVFVFFFKQKTAYEMRISDWSSDVCSSDLATTSADGILYTSRFDNQPCVALFDRSADAIEPALVHGIAITHAQATSLAAGFGKTYVEP